MKLHTYIYIFAALVFMTASCNEKKKPLGPEEVTKALVRAVAVGDFSTAHELCDTALMKSYLENCRETMISMQKEDSCAFRIAAEMLSGAEFEVKDVQKDGDTRIVRYSFAAEGKTRTKKAALQKKEGEWIVISITDAI